MTVGGNQVSWVGGGNCAAADVDHEIYIVKISRIFVLSLHHSTGVELLELTPGLPDNPMHMHAQASRGILTD